MVVTIPFKLAANNVLLLKYFNKGRFLAASRHRCSKIVSSFQNYNLNMQSSTAENWAPCACTFDLASAGVLEMTDRVYCEQDMRDFSQKYFKINKIFKPSHKVYKNVKYCKQDIDQTDLHNIVAETDGPVSRCALGVQLPALGWLKVQYLH